MNTTTSIASNRGSSVTTVAVVPVTFAEAAREAATGTRMTPIMITPKASLIFVFPATAISYHLSHGLYVTSQCCSITNNFANVGYMDFVHINRWLTKNMHRSLKGMTRISRWIVRLFPKYREKEFWIEQGIRLGSWITIIIIFLALRDMALTPPQCPVANLSQEFFDNLTSNITKCVCVAAQA